MEENFISFQPRHEVLSELIDYYYVHETRNSVDRHTVIYYPNFNTAINYYENAHVSWDDNGRVITSNTEGESTCLLTRYIKRARYVTTEGSVKKVGIVFKPLGINHFLSCDFRELAGESVNVFEHFGNHFSRHMNEVLSAGSIDEKRNLLDSLLLSRLRGFRNEILRTIVSTILDSGGSVTVSGLAVEMKMSRKTILRLFRKHLCISPSEFITLVKFRNALHAYKSNEPLTQIGYDNNFYDQADFIKKFKKLGGLTPKKLFSSIVERGDYYTLWSPPK